MAAYLGLGVLLWFFVHASGIHATIAGVLLAFTVPTRTRINAEEFSRDARALLDDFDRTETGDLLVLTSKGQQDAIVGLERASESVTPPLVTLEHALHSFSAFVVMPLFALSNAGVTLSNATIGPVTVGVILGLMVGKPLGITAAALGATKAGLATLPQGVSRTALHGSAWLAGIGFTMSLFIATLAFRGRLYSTPRRSASSPDRFSPERLERSLLCVKDADPSRHANVPNLRGPTASTPQRSPERAPDRWRSPSPPADRSRSDRCSR